MDKVKVQNSWARSAPIGKGSFGTVSLAVNKSNGAVFAVKSVDRYSSLPSQIEALENEIRILRSLSSPFVVEYLGDDTTLGNGGTTSFRNLHMEYLPGGTVADVARAKNTPPWSDVDEKIIRNYTFCIVSGLQYLHSQGIVHCDVKSDNVLVGPTLGTAKLADFGSAMERHVPSCKNRIVPRGSPLWMAPEVVRGEHQGPESDVWSLGCTVIEMLTGKPAWEDKGPAETLFRIGCSDELPRLPTQLSELGRDFLEKCLRREVKERWSCDQLLQHPFISKCSSSSSSTYSSPRCVLDWFNLDSDEEGEEERSSAPSTICNSQVKGRIGKLASERGAIWESDGWVEVRGLVCEVSPSVTDAGSCCTDEGEGTSSAYPELMGAEGEVEGAELEYEDSIGIAEFRGGTSGESLPDSNCSAGVEVRNDSNHYGVVTNTTDPGWEREAGLSHSRCSSRFLLLLYLYLKFYTIDHKICNQFFDSIRCIRNFCYISSCMSVCARQQFYLNFGNLLLLVALVFSIFFRYLFIYGLKPLFQNKN